MALDLEGTELEGMFWRPCGELRWHRPKGGTDNDIRLELLWERVTGERQWRLIPTILED